MYNLLAVSHCMLCNKQVHTIPIIFSISAHSSISYSLTRMHAHEWEIKELPTSSYTGGEYLSLLSKMSYHIVQITHFYIY